MLAAGEQCGFLRTHSPYSPEGWSQYPCPWGAALPAPLKEPSPWGVALGQPPSWHVPSPHQLPSHSAKLRRGLWKHTLILLQSGCWPTGSRDFPDGRPLSDTLLGTLPTSQHTWTPSLLGVPTPAAWGQQGLCRQRGGPEHPSICRHQRRAGEARGWGEARERSKERCWPLPAFCNIIANLKWLTLKIQVINLKTQASTPAHQGNTYSTTALRKLQICV